MANESNKKKVSGKSALLAVGVSSMMLGIELYSKGSQKVGAITSALGLLLVASYVLVNERDIPYEDEILEIIGEYNLEDEDVERVAREVKEQMEEGQE